MPLSVIVDFDNTMGVPDCDVDDALALLHLLGNPQAVQVAGACTCYGNSTIDVVRGNTERLFDLWGLDVPLYHGAANPIEPTSDASAFIARCAAEHPGEISILATGSMTNLRGAALEDPSFFSNIQGVFLMGGIERSLAINGRIMNELNLSCDPLASRMVLEAPCPVTVATAQSCLDAFFTLRDFEDAFGAESWLYETCAPWFRTMECRYDWNGFACWDVVAAACISHPELFDMHSYAVTLNERLLSVGYLEHAASEAPQAEIFVPSIIDPPAFSQAMLDSWKQGMMACPGLHGR